MAVSTVIRGTSRSTNKHIARADVPKVLTQQDLHGALAHEIVYVDFGVAHFPEFVDRVAAVDVEQRHERLEHVQMERGRDQFPVCPPFVACGWAPGRVNNG